MPYTCITHPDIATTLTTTIITQTITTMLTLEGWHVERIQWNLIIWIRRGYSVVVGSIVRWGRMILCSQSHLLFNIRWWRIHNCLIRGMVKIMVLIMVVDTIITIEIITITITIITITITIIQAITITHMGIEITTPTLLTTTHI